MKKRYVFLGSLISAFLLFALKIVYDFFRSRSDENILLEIKTKDAFFENWLIYLGSLLILISIIGITMILYNPYVEEKNNKNLKFEDLYSSTDRK